MADVVEAQRGSEIGIGDGGAASPALPGRAERGIALIIVTFVVALATILVVNLAYSVYLEARLNSNVERSLRAEYILKSGISLARVLLKSDTTPEDNPDDAWQKFKNGVPIPPQFLGISDPNVRIEIEIRPEESKMPLRDLVPLSLGSADTRWRGAVLRLFQKLGFDSDQEPDHTGLFPDRVFSSEEMVANLIDYLDTDPDTYNADDFARGIEGDLPEGYFPKERITGFRIGELNVIPGFTPARLKKLTLFVTTVGNSRVNLNMASSAVLEALHEDITPQMVQQIIAFREGEDGPFLPESQKIQLTNIVGEDIYNEITVLIGVTSTYFQVLAKVDYGTSTYFMRTYLSKGRVNDLPAIRSIELF